MTDFQLSPAVLTGDPPAFDLDGRKRYGPHKSESKRFTTDSAGKIIGAEAINQDVTTYHPGLMRWAKQVAAKVATAQADAIDDALLDNGQGAMDATARADFERKWRPVFAADICRLYAGILDASLAAREDA